MKTLDKRVEEFKQNVMAADPTIKSNEMAFAKFGFEIARMEADDEISILKTRIKTLRQELKEFKTKSDL